MKTKIKFNPFKPAYCLTQTIPGPEGVYQQDAYCWYYNGKESCLVDYLPHLSEKEIIIFGRQQLKASLLSEEKI